MSSDTLSPAVAEAIRTHFAANFAERGEVGASMSIVIGEEEVLGLSQGLADKEAETPWTSETIVPVWSATKGVAAVTALMALERTGLWLSDRVADLWPDFAQAGKESVTFAQLLSHTAGLSALNSAVPIEDYAAVVQALEQQPPVAAPGTLQAYHARTFGFLLDQIVRLSTGGMALGAFFRAEIGDPMGLDFWIGLPEPEWPRVATLYPARMRAGAPADAFLKAFNDPQSLTRRTFASPVGLNAVREMNQGPVLAQGLASFGGVGSARALATFYAMLAGGGIWKGNTLVSERVCMALEHTLSQSDEDGVLHSPIAFGPGVMRDPVDTSGQKKRRLYGNGLRSYGHPGAGGSLAFGDPERRMGFAYVMNQMEMGALPNEKALGLMRLIP